MAERYKNPELLRDLERRAREAGYTPPPDVRFSLGGCVEAIDTPRRGAFRRKAHAHNFSGDAYRWWICVLSSKPGRLVTASGKPTRLALHEYAHLLAPSEYHGERWRKAVAAIGAPSEAKRG